MNPQRLNLHYRIKWQGRWHVGNGYQSAAVDRLQRRARLPFQHESDMTYNQSAEVGKPAQQRSLVPVVPGSQIKGVLRHHCERLAIALGLRVVDPHAGTEAGDRSLVANFRSLANSDLLIDRLFGSRYQGECLFVTNALPVPAALERHPPTVAVRTAIDRVTGTARDQHLFATELIEQNVCLHGDIRARHPRSVLTQDEDGEGFPFEYALLVAGLLSLESLGGDRSMGLGRCEISLKPSSLRWNGKAISLDDALKSFEEVEWADMLELLRESSEDQTS